MGGGAGGGQIQCKGWDEGFELDEALNVISGAFFHPEAGFGLRDKPVFELRCELPVNTSLLPVL